MTPLQLSATDSSSTATLSLAAAGLPAGLSISPSGLITGTPSTGGSFSVVVTATDSAGFGGFTAPFTWSITNTVTVTNPGVQSNPTGAPITALAATATDSSSTATITTWSATGLPTGLTMGASSGVISGTPITAGTYTVALSATDSAGATGSASFTWTTTNTVSLTSPGPQSGASGSPITALQAVATDSSSTATLTYSASGLPAGLAMTSRRAHHRHAHHRRGLPGGPHATDSAGFTGSASFTWTVTNTITVTGPGPQSGASGSPITPVQVVASDSSPTATLAYGATGLPTGLSIDPASGLISGTPTTSGAFPVTVTVSDGAGSATPTSFTWTLTNPIIVTVPGPRSDVVRPGHHPLGPHGGRLVV